MKIFYLSVYLTISLVCDLYAESRVVFRKDTIEIKFENKGKVVYANYVKEYSERWSKHWYLGYYQSIGYHKLGVDGYESHDSYLLINGNNGKVTSFFECDPVFIGDDDLNKSKPFIACSQDGYHGPSKLTIYAVKDSIQPIWNKTLENNHCWEFGKIIGPGPKSFLIEKIIQNKKDFSIRNTVLESVNLVNGQWTLEDKWKADDSCNWILSKADSTQLK